MEGYGVLAWALRKGDTQQWRMAHAGVKACSVSVSMAELWLLPSGAIPIVCCDAALQAQLVHASAAAGNDLRST
eukprot:1159385-Pelagomonas_calceolata.AAC.5